MILLVKLAWRNIWRNRRRTFISCSAIAFAVIIAVFANSFQKGIWDYAINSLVKTHVGHLQVHHKGYWENQEMDMAFALSDSLHSRLLALPSARASTARLEGFAMAYNDKDSNSRAAMIRGIEATREIEFSALDKKVIKGKYLQKETNEILLAEKLAKSLDLKIGDSITLISSGYHAANAAGIYPVAGIIRFGNPELNKRLVLMNIETAQQFFDAKGLATTALLQVQNQHALDQTIAQANTVFDSSAYEIMSWEALIPEIVQARDLKLSGNAMVLAVIYLIIAFGIWGTVLMMTKERQHEFGVLTAIGLQRKQLAIILWLETAMMGLLAAIAGIMIGIPLVAYFHFYPVSLSGEMAETYEKFGLEPLLPTAFEANIFIQQTLVVLLLTSFLSLYPIIKALRIRAIQALR